MRRSSRARENIFERMVYDLSKIVQTKNLVVDVANAQQEQKLKLLALECCVTIMKSLVDWSKELQQRAVSDHQKSPNEQKDNEGEEKKEALSPQQVTKKPSSLQPDFNEEKKRKTFLVEATKKFNKNPKKGMKLLVEMGHVENNSTSVARFLRTVPGLDKAAIGDYLGEGDAFNKEVLSKFVELFDFTGKDVDVSIRELLRAFRLPGEAQKIDRMMEKFAERYFQCNASNVFANADAVYVLSFAIVMLATDLHSPAIKNKMTKDQWRKMQRGVNDTKDFPEDFLMGLYDRIAAERLSLNDEESNLVQQHDLSSDPKRRKMMFQKEMETVIDKTKLQLLKPKDRGIFYRAKQIEHVKPMFELSWPPFLAAFSVLLETSDESEVFVLCLDGVKYAVRVTCVFGMEVERNALVTSLSKFTHLSNLREMKPKNIQAIKVLLEIARTEANDLHDSWIAVLRCISQLEQLQLLGSGAKFGATPPARASTGPQKVDNKFENQNAQVITEQIDPDLIDRIFANSITLNADAIQDFVRCLCDVSKDEITQQPPRLFSLQKLVELAHFNMSRIRIVWTRIWKMLADHFTIVGCDSRIKVSMYAIDSLKQLAMKFLEKEELAHYHFQKEFLKPFETIMQNNQDATIRDIIVRCLANMVLARASNIKSGWKGILVVYTVAANERDESIVSVAFDSLQAIIKQFFAYITESFFNELTNCLVAFANNTNFPEKSLAAIGQLRQCATKLASGGVLELKKVGDTNKVFTDDEKHLSLWFPILTGLSKIISHSNKDVRNSALTTLFKILNEYGQLFHSNLWILIFRGVLLPIFDNVKYDDLREDDEWLSTCCLSALTCLIELFIRYFDDLNFMLKELLNLLGGMIVQNNEKLARIGVTSFLQFSMSNGQKFDSQMWSVITDKLAEILKQNIPEVELKAIEDSPQEQVMISRKSTSQSSLPTAKNTNASTNSSKRKAARKSDSDDDSSENETRVQKRKFHQSTEDTDEETQEAKQTTTTDDDDDSSDDEQTTKRPTDKIDAKKTVKSRLAIQIVLIEAVNDIAFTHYSTLNTAQMVALLSSLHLCTQLATYVNNSTILQSKLSATGILTVILRIEMTSLTCFLRLVFRMYGEDLSHHPDRVQLAESRLINVCLERLSEYIRHCPPLSNTMSIGHNQTQHRQLTRSQQRRHSAFNQVIVQILQGFFEMSNEQFNLNLKVLYPVFCDLLASESPEVRSVLRNVLIRVGKLKKVID